LNRELDIIVETYSMAGGEYQETVGKTPSLIVEALDYLLDKHKDDPVALDLLKRLRENPKVW
jgi:hypothetical protein